MPVTNNVVVQEYGGSLLALNLLSGNANNLVLNALGPSQATQVTENNNVLQVGETAHLGIGANVTVLGSGTVQPGINLFGATVPTGTARAAVLVQDNATGDLYFLYPDGTPNLLGAVALVVRMTPVNYGFPGGVMCFATGTQIATARGLRPVETIRPGQRVLTADHGLRRVLWVATRVIDVATLRAREAIRPVRIPAGALGGGLPAAPLTVSPQHRMLLRSPRGLSGGDEVLVAARHLIGRDGISAVLPADGVVYHHLLLDRHEILFAEGSPSESLFTGPEALRTLAPDDQLRVMALRPDVQVGPAKAARPFLTARDCRRLWPQANARAPARIGARPAPDVLRPSHAPFDAPAAPPTAPSAVTPPSVDPRPAAARSPAFGSGPDPGRAGF